MVTLESLQQDLEKVPPGKEKKDKYYAGFWQAGKLIAVLDVIKDFPKTNHSLDWFFYAR